MNKEEKHTELYEWKKKELITVQIAVHSIQKRIIDGLQSGKIELSKTSNDSLREIARKIGQKESPQQIKHHLEQLVKLGVIQKIYCQYVYFK